MRTKTTIYLTLFSTSQLFASTGAEQAKMLVMGLASVVIILIFSYRNKNKKND